MQPLRVHNSRFLCPSFVIVLLALPLQLALLADLGWSGPPIGDAPPEDDIRRRRDEDVRPGLLPVMKGETRLTGTVMNLNKQPLPGIQVKLVVNGVVAHLVSTDAVGQYDFKHPINITGNETVSLWFVDPSHRLTPKGLVMAESEPFRALKLLSPCYARILFEPIVESKVYLFDRENRARQLVGQGCI